MDSWCIVEYFVIHLLCNQFNHSPTNQPHLIMAFDFSQLQSLLQQAENTAAAEASIRKALVRIQNYQDSIGKEVESIYSMLDGNLPAPNPQQATRTKRGAVERDAEAPFGRKKDGTPMKPRGRGAAARAAESTGELELNTSEPADSSEAGAAEEAASSGEELAQKIEASVTPAAKPIRVGRQK